MASKTTTIMPLPDQIPSPTFPHISSLLRAKMFKERSMDEPLESGALLTKYVVTLLKHAARLAAPLSLDPIGR